MQLLTFSFTSSINSHIASIYTTIQQSSSSSSTNSVITLKTSFHGSQFFLLLLGFTWSFICNKEKKLLNNFFSLSHEKNFFLNNFAMNKTSRRTYLNLLHSSWYVAFVWISSSFFVKFLSSMSESEKKRKK